MFEDPGTPESSIRQEGSAVAIRCAHGDTVLYLLAEISVKIDGQPINIEAAVSNTLPVSLLLGTDNPELPELLEGRIRGDDSKTY